MAIYMCDLFNCINKLRSSNIFEVRNPFLLLCLNALDKVQVPIQI